MPRPLKSLNPSISPKKSERQETENEPAARIRADDLPGAHAASWLTPLRT